MNIKSYNNIWLNKLAEDNLKLAHDFDNLHNTTKVALSFGDYRMKGGVRDRAYPMVGTDESTYTPSPNAISEVAGISGGKKKKNKTVSQFNSFGKGFQEGFQIPFQMAGDAATAIAPAVALANGAGKGSAELEKAKDSLKKFVSGERKTKPSKKHIELLEKNGLISKKVNEVVEDATGGKVSRIKKAEKWRDYSVDTIDKGLDLASKGKNIFGGSLDGGKVNRLKKAKSWASFSADTIDKGLDLGLKAKMIAGAKKPSAWIAFVKSYASKHNITYKEALSKAGPEYKKLKR